MKKRPSCPLILASLAMAASLCAAQDPAAAPPAAEPVAPAQSAPPAAEPVAPAQSAPPAAEPVPSAPAQPAAVLPPEAGFSPQVVEAIGNPPEGKGLVVFFRPSRFIGAAVGFIVREGTTELGKLRSGNYFPVAVEPGKHAYVVHSEAKDIINLEVEAGETYFLAGSVSIGAFVGRPNLSPSDVQAFEAALPKMKKSAPLK